MKLLQVMKKIRDKGVGHILRIFVRSYIYDHDHLYLVERSLTGNYKDIQIEERWVLVTESDIGIFNKNFKRYVQACRGFFREGSRPFVYLDDNGDAYLMQWVNVNGDYFDNDFKCTVPVPEGCIYQFAAELEKSRRSRSRDFLVGHQQRLWQEYASQGFTRIRSLVSGRNLPAVGIQLYLGFREVGHRVHVHRLFGHFTWSYWEQYDGEHLIR